MYIKLEILDYMYKTVDLKCNKIKKKNTNLPLLPLMLEQISQVFSSSELGLCFNI